MEGFAYFVTCWGVLQPVTWFNEGAARFGAKGEATRYPNKEAAKAAADRAKAANPKLRRQIIVDFATVPEGAL